MMLVTFLRSCNFLAKIYDFAHIYINGRGQMGKFRRPNIFFRPRKFCNTIIYNTSEHEACKSICRTFTVIRLARSVTIKRNQIYGI